MENRISLRATLGKTARINGKPDQPLNAILCEIGVLNSISSLWATGRNPHPPPLSLLGQILDLYWIEVYPIPTLN